MQKVFALLLLELRKLRASIVFADFSRIIIATGKYDMAAAQGYCEYLLKTLKSRYIFYPSIHPSRQIDDNLQKSQGYVAVYVQIITSSSVHPLEDSVQWIGHYVK